MPVMFPLQVLPGPVPQFPPRWRGIEQGSPAQRWISGDSGEVWQKGHTTKRSHPGSVASVASKLVDIFFFLFVC